jgi:Tfp pilus assembly protein PilX
MSMRGRHQQRGVVLFVAVIVLIVMSLAGLALMRQMGAGTSIAGNIAFKETATSVADRGVESARAWLLSNPNLLWADNPTLGYYATWAGGVDPAGYTWTNAGSVLMTGADSDSNTGHETRYIIQRLCQNVGSPVVPGQSCSDGVVNNSGSTRGGASYGNPNFEPPPGPFYRVTARVTGPRNTFSFVQVVMN